jgi:hypothetical protein
MQLPVSYESPAPAASASEYSQPPETAKPQRKVSQWADDEEIAPTAPPRRPHANGSAASVRSASDQLVAEAAAEYGDIASTSATSIASDDPDLPQRSRKGAPTAEAFGFSNRLAEPTTGGDRSSSPTRRGAFAAIQEAKRAVEDAASSVVTLEKTPVVESSQPVKPEPAAPATTTQTESPALANGLIQRRPGKVFSSAEKAADAGAFRRLGDGSTEEQVAPAASRFAALSKLQRGVSTARTTDSPTSSVED